MSRWTTEQKHLKLLPMIFVAGIVALFSLAMSGGVAAAHTNDIPGGKITDPVVRAVDIAQPAVVRILTVIDGRLIVQFSSGSVTFPQGGGNAYQLQLLGSGTFITAHGDILTADHVVNPPDQELQQAAAPDVANYINQTLHANPQVTADQVFQELATGQLNSTTQYNTPQSTVFLSTAFTGPLSATRIQDVPASVFATVDRIEKQSSFNATDVAIIHVNGMNDTPMVQLGDSSGVQTQDQLSIIGFPGAADVSQTATNLLTSSVNIVNVSSIKTSDSGAPLIQVGGTVEPGDSGGPALDASGTVVGIVSFALTSTGGTSFLQASNSARTLVQQLGLDTTPGPFQKAWSQAFNDYGSTNAGHWHKAAQEFQQLAKNYPQFKGIMPYLQYAQQQAATEKQPVTQPVTQTNSSKSFLTSYWPILVAGAVIVLGLLLFGVVIIQRRGAKPVLATSGQRYEASSNGNGAMANPFAPNPTGNQSYFMPSAQAIQPPNTSTVFGAPSAPNAPSWNTPTAFGAPSAPNGPSWTTPAPTPASPQPAQPPAYAPPWMSQLSSQGTSNVESERTDFLVPWPCGHLNRRSAHFCTVCGEPAPRLPSLPPIRRYEQ